MYVGTLKMVTTFMFVFSALVLAPAFAQDGDWAMVAGVLVGGTVPMLALARITAPFVTHLHLHLPVYARRSPEILLRFARTLSPEAELDLTTLRFLGTPGLTRAKVGELRPVKRWLSIANLVRVPPPASASAPRPWWRRDQRNFYVGPVAKGGGGIREKVVWELVLDGIKKGFAAGRLVDKNTSRTLY